MAKPQRHIPWLEQRNNGVYYIHWYDAAAGRTVRRSLKCQDIEQAKAAFGRFLLGGESKLKHSDVRLGVGAAIEAYLAEHVAVNCADVERQRGIAKHLVSFFKGTPLRDVSIPESRAYAKWRDASPATIKRELGMLVAAANHARKWKRLSADDMPTVEYPAVPTAKIDIFTPEEVAEIVKASSGELRLFILLAYLTAARRKSVETLQFYQIDAERRTIDFRKDEEYMTGKRHPIVPVSLWCLGLIGELHLNRYLEGEKVDSDDDYSYVFSPNANFYRPFKRLCKRVLGRDCHPHMLRHSRATHLLQAGQDIYKVAGLLGDTVKTIESTYGHHTPEHAATAVAPSDALLEKMLGV